VCRIAPTTGDVIALGDVFFEILQPQPPPDVDGQVQDIHARSLADQPLGPGVGLVGNALFLSTYQPADPVPRGCWLSFVPQAELLPVTGVSPAAKVLVRFSEPMDPGSISPFDDFMVVFGDSNTVVNPTNLAVGEIKSSTDLKEFSFEPTLPLRHGASAAETYHVQIAGPTDLAGNDLAEVLPAINFTMSPAQPEVRNGSRVLRFNEIDELDPIGLTDLRGQFFYDFDAGAIRPRPVTYTSYPADRTNPVPSIMIAFNRLTTTPLSPLGSKLHAVWRYCDLGWQVLDETKYNLDVFGLSWTPKGGTVINDYYDTFEIRLAHARRQPDEWLDPNSRLPAWINSGLVGAGTDFTQNILEDPLSPQKVVNRRSQGYQIRGADLFLASSGRIMLPYPLNRGSETPITYTWRDTAVLAKGAPGGAGIPLSIEGNPPLSLEDAPSYVARAGQVPSFGLPLLIEYRCFPSDQGIGLNALDILLAINSSPQPSFRSYSTGGYDRDGRAVVRNPDQELRPRGGFNPLATPPGTPTARADDNALYIGQLDAVTRVSRVHTIWIDTVLANPDFIAPIVLPLGSDQPSGTEVVVEYRGAHGFVLEDLDSDLGAVTDESLFPFDSQRLDAYGDIFVRLDNPGNPLPPNPPLPDYHHVLGTPEFAGRVQYVGGVGTWSDDIDSIDSGQFLQLRITFLSNIETRLSPVLSAIGIAYSER
jgi:hypothetical protein